MVIAAVTGRQITIYGDGKQIRDVLYVEDLLDVYDAAVENIDTCAGQVFNIGGGPENTMSIWTEFGSMLESILGRQIPVAQGNWRPGDQKVFVADIRKAARQLGWKPMVGVREGVGRLVEWVQANRESFTSPL